MLQLVLLEDTVNTGSDAGRMHDFVEPGHAESSWS